MVGQSCTDAKIHPVWQAFPSHALNVVLGGDVGMCSTSALRKLDGWREWYADVRASRVGWRAVHMLGIQETNIDAQAGEASVAPCQGGGVWSVLQDVQKSGRQEKAQWYVWENEASEWVVWRNPVYYHNGSRCPCMQDWRLGTFMWTGEGDLRAPWRLTQLLNSSNTTGQMCACLSTLRRWEWKVMSMCFFH